MEEKKRHNTLGAGRPPLQNYNDGLTGRERYEKNRIYRFSVSFSKQKNPEIFQKLQEVDNKTSYILDLIKKDLEKEGDN
jgi:hypothetical protein